MDDLISRRAAIDALNKLDVSDGVGISSVACDLQEKAIRSIKNLPSVQPVEDIHREKEQAYYCGYEDGAKVTRSELPSVQEQRWIPVQERMPLGDELVIVSCHDDSGDTNFDYVSVGWVTRDGKYWVVENEANYYVCAWMPLPDPYKEGE